MKYFLILFFLVTQSVVFAQFKGYFVYKAELPPLDSTGKLKVWQIGIATNDTVVRVETQTEQLGNQVYIRNMELNKAYLLIDMGADKFAIQTDLNTKSKDSIKADYTFKKKLIGKKIAGVKCKKYVVKFNGDTTEYFCYFSKKHTNKYLEVFEKIPGLALDYYLPTQDGVIHYSILTISPEVIDRNLFGIPADYKRVSFDQFMQVINPEGENKE